MNIKTIGTLVIPIIILLSNSFAQSISTVHKNQAKDKSALTMLASMQVIGLALSSATTGACIGGITVAALGSLFGVGSFTQIAIGNCDKIDEALYVGLVFGAVMGGIYAKRYFFNKLKESCENDPIKDSFI